VDLRNVGIVGQKGPVNNLGLKKFIKGLEIRICVA